MPGRADGEAALAIELSALSTGRHHHAGMVACDDQAVAYRYEDLGDDEFQSLISALVAWDGSRRARAMPLGQADGGRDFVDGPTTSQAKFTRALGRRDPVTWLLTALDGEENSIKGLVSRGTRHYVLATNVAGTGRLDVGTIDRLDPELKAREQAWGLDSLTVWWRDDVDARFAAAPLPMKLRFQRALRADELLSVTLVDQSPTAERLDRALAAYIADRFHEDNRVRFEQADLNGPTVEKLFVDVPVTCPTATSPPGVLLDRIGSPGDGDDTGTARWSAGAARLLLHPEWTGNAVIVGGPGQGKTTLLQSICQFERARHLRRDAYVDELKPNGPVSPVARLPIQVDLRRYAAWSKPDGPERDDEDRTDPARSLEVYLAQHVSSGSGGLQFSVEDLAAVVAGRPVLLALDGLDEVASLHERSRVAGQISRSAVRLQQSALDLVILVATRPGATSVTSLLGEKFPVLHLQRLTKALRLRYLDRWATQAGLDQETTAQLRATFIANYQLPHVRELASNPMQLAILLNLLQRRGILPEQRTKLYDDYIKVFLDRESPKEPVVRDNRILIEEAHGYLAWHLQSSAEAEGGSGALPIDELHGLLQDFLRDRGPKEQVLTELFTAVTSRVICLVQRESGFEFEVQPLREYFAGRHIFENSGASQDHNSRDDCLDELLRRPYWSNVVRFFAGRLSPMEVRAVPSSLRTVQGTDPFNRLPLCRSTAAQLLNDQVFLHHKLGPIREAVDVALDAAGALLAVDGLLDMSGGRFLLGEDAARDQAAAHCKERLPQAPHPQTRAALARLLTDHDDAAAIRAWWWDAEQRESTPAWLATAGDLGVLNDLSEAEIRHVLSCTDDSQSEPLVSVLLRARSNTHDDSLLRRATTELGDGATHGAEPLPGTAAAVEHLCRWSHPKWFLARRPLSDAGSRRRVRSRPGAGPTETARRLEALHTTGGEWRTAEWLAALGVISDGFGDCWLLREAALSVPQDHLPISAAQPSLAGEATTEQLLSWIAAAHEKRKDSGWWRDQRPDPADQMAVRTFASAVVSIAAATAVTEVVPFLNEALTTLPAASLNSLLMTAQRQATPARGRRLDLYDAVRLRQVQPTAQVALLLHPAAFETTQAQLAPLIVQGLGSLLMLGTELAALTMAIATSADRRPQVAVFEGTRATVPAGTIFESTGVARPTLHAARGILNRPHLWPTDLVHLATDRLGEQLAQQPALADVARTNGWFSD